MENSTEIALRPLRLGEILDQAIRLYRHNFLTFISLPYIYLRWSKIERGHLRQVQVSVSSARIRVLFPGCTVEKFI